MTRAALVVGLALILAGLAGCASSTEKYCGTLKDDRPTLTRLARSAGSPDRNALGDSLRVFKELRAAAPEDLRDEWDTYVFAWEGVTDAFHRAGISPQDYSPGEPPKGVTSAQAKQIEDAAAELRSPRVVDAGKGIEQHARDVCKVDLGL